MIQNLPCEATDYECWKELTAETTGEASQYASKKARDAKDYVKGKVMNAKD